MFRRGQEYFDDGRVFNCVDEDGRVSACVMGTRVYRVALWLAVGEWLFDCECPVGLSGEFCKHVVALGLSQLNPSRKVGSVKSFGFLLEHTINLLVAGDSDLAQEAVNERIRVVLEYLLKAGAAANALGLIEKALRMFAEAQCLCGADKTEWNKLEDLLCEFYVMASRLTADGAETGIRRLFASQLNLIGEGIPGELFGEKLQKRCTEVLDNEWVEVYQRLIGEHWAKLSQVENEEWSLSQRRQFVWLSHRMERLAQQRGDFDKLIASKIRVLKGVDDYVACAQLFQRNGLVEQAIETAKQGLELFPGQSRPLTLRNLLISIYEDSGRGEEALEWLWQEFISTPNLASYRYLKEVALRSSSWSRWKDQLVEHLRRCVLKSGKTSQKARGRSRAAEKHCDNSELVSIWLDEGYVDEAWLAANIGDCSDELWLKLASLRVRKEPLAALTVYQRLVKSALSRKDGYSAQRALKILVRVRRLMARLNLNKEFDDYVSGLQQTYGNQRTFRTQRKV